jgi:hypothetical protein
MGAIRGSHEPPSPPYPGPDPQKEFRPHRRRVQVQTGLHVGHLPFSRVRPHHQQAPGLSLKQLCPVSQTPPQPLHPLALDDSLAQSDQEGFVRRLLEALQEGLFEGAGEDEVVWYVHCIGQVGEEILYRDEIGHGTAPAL